MTFAYCFVIAAGIAGALSCRAFVYRRRERSDPKNAVKQHPLAELAAGLGVHFRRAKQPPARRPLQHFARAHGPQRGGARRQRVAAAPGAAGVHARVFAGGGDVMRASRMAPCRGRLRPAAAAHRGPRSPRASVRVCIRVFFACLGGLQLTLALEMTTKASVRPKRSNPCPSSFAGMPKQQAPRTLRSRASIVAAGGGGKRSTARGRRAAGCHAGSRGERGE